MRVDKVKSAAPVRPVTRARLALPSRLPQKAMNFWRIIPMHEYKVVPAPERAPKVKGLKTTAQRFAHVLAERINAEAAGGWEFLRAETLPCETRGALGSVRQVAVTMMVFARPLGQLRPDAGAALAAMHEAERGWSDDAVAPQAPAWQAPVQPAAAPPRREPLFRAGPMLRSDAPQRAEPVLRPRLPEDETY